MPKHLGVGPFPDPIGNFGAPWWPFWILQAVSGSNWYSVAGGDWVPLSPLGWYFLYILRMQLQFDLFQQLLKGFCFFWVNIFKLVKAVTQTLFYVDVCEDEEWVSFLSYDNSFPQFRIHSITKNTAKRNMSSAVCASSMYSCLCIKMLSFLFVHAWAMPHILYSSCGIPFPV